MAEVKAVIVKSLLEVKKSSGKPYNQIAVETGLTNVYCLYPLTDSSSVSKTLYNVSIILFRLNEAMMHFGESIKDIVNEEFGDGIMSAIDFYCSVDKIKGYDGKEQISAHMLSCSQEPAIKQADQRRRVEKAQRLLLSASIKPLGSSLLASTFTVFS